MTKCLGDITAITVLRAAIALSEDDYYLKYLKSGVDTDQYRATEDAVEWDKTLSIFYLHRWECTEILGFDSYENESKLYILAVKEDRFLNSPEIKRG